MSPKDGELLSKKQDGHRYSRPTRRIVRLLDLARPKYINLSDLAEVAARHPEFYRTRMGEWGPMSPTRVRDYVNFARMAGYVAGDGDLVRAFDQVPTRGKLDPERWTAITSQQALEFLQKLLRVEGGAVHARDRLHELLQQLEATKKQPTIAALAKTAGISGTREEEVFGWALRIHMDGGNSRFALFYPPRILWKG